MRPTILLTGATGYIGQIISRHLQQKYTIVGVNQSGREGIIPVYQCDITNVQHVRQLASRIKPTLIIHAAGNKDIAKCEKDADTAYNVNGYAVKYLLKCFFGCKMIYISSDYVFDGYKGNYLEKDVTNPTTVYGKSKQLGEKIGLAMSSYFYSLRISALYDHDAKFPRFLLEQMRQGNVVSCFSDVIYSPVYYRDFLSMLDQLITSQETEQKIFHCAGEIVSRYDFAKIFARTFRFSPNLVKESVYANCEGVLFPNLSLQDTLSRVMLGTTKTSLPIALEEMRRVIS